MNRVNRKVEYALMALKTMGQEPGKLFSVREISAERHAPFDVMSRVMQKMARSKILAAEQGSQGGYRLHQSLKELSFYRLLESVDGELQIAKCKGHESLCDLFATCNIASPLQSLNIRLADFYRSLNVADLLSDHKAHSTKPQRLLLELEQ